MAAQSEAASYGSLKEKRVFVTGGGSGIGASIVAAFAEQEARVAFVDIDADSSLALCEEIARDGHEKPIFRPCDIRDIPALQETMRELAADIGDFDVLVNNAGNDQRHTLEEVTVDYWDDRIAINERPMFFTCQAVAEGMKQRGGGCDRFRDRQPVVPDEHREGRIAARCGGIHVSATTTVQVCSMNP